VNFGRSGVDHGTAHHAGWYRPLRRTAPSADAEGQGGEPLPVPDPSPTGHRFGRPRRLASDPPLSATPGATTFAPLPPPPGPYPFHLDLAQVVGADAVTAITEAGVLGFHTVGDTGGIANPVPQENVALAIERDLPSAPGSGFDPSFLYILGDCIYFNGEESNYYAQFYEPYLHYTRPIVAVPGNHDGMPLPPGQTTLDGFLQNFCTLSPVTNPQSMSSGRTTMTQPNVYWTLDAPFATIVGLYTNISETDGQLDATQIAWLRSELAVAATDRALLLTMHHPAISADSTYGGADTMYQLIDTAAAGAGRWPDLILAGHVHNYQRFTRTVTTGAPTSEQIQVPYVVAGGGGYHNLHLLAADAAAATLPWPMPNLPGVTLEAADDAHYGYCRVEVDAKRIRCEFVQVSPPPGVADTAISPTVTDSFTYDLQAKSVTAGVSAMDDEPSKAKVAKAEKATTKKSARKRR
jgi:hypothetical protein